MIRTINTELAGKIELFKDALKGIGCTINSYELELNEFSDPDSDAVLRMQFVIPKALLENQEQVQLPEEVVIQP
jgi:hypothetical protein